MKDKLTAAWAWVAAARKKIIRQLGDGEIELLKTLNGRGTEK